MSTSGVGGASCGGWSGRLGLCRLGATGVDWYIELAAER